MTLDKFMKTEADESTVYYIGSNSGFVFIGTKADYEKYIMPISYAYKMAFQERFNKASTNLHSIDIRSGDILFSYDEEKIKSEYDKIVDCFAMAAFKKVNELLNYQKSFSTFIGFKRREVVKDYDRLTDGHAVIISGDEEGAFWFKEEFAEFTSKYDAEIGKYTSEPTKTAIMKESFNAFKNRASKSIDESNEIPVEVNK